MSEVNGRCLCGAVTYAYEGDVNWTGHCHCESCRRTCSAPVTTFFAVNNGQWRWTGAAPSVYASSPQAKRYFCAKCGTPMAYTHDKFDHEIHFYAASLDDPEGFVPTQHFHYDERLPWLHLSDDLKKHGVGGL
ncbi:MAG: GFA family protein [Pseudomonadota bacterium]